MNCPTCGHCLDRAIPVNSVTAVDVYDAWMQDEEIVGEVIKFVVIQEKGAALKRKPTKEILTEQP